VFTRAFLKNAITNVEVKRIKQAIIFRSGEQLHQLLKPCCTGIESIPVKQRLTLMLITKLFLPTPYSGLY